MENYEVNAYIVTSDDFLSMSTEAQLLYFFLCASRNYDKVFNVKATMRGTNINDEALKELVDHEYLTLYESNVYKIQY